MTFNFDLNDENFEDDEEPKDEELEAEAELEPPVEPHIQSFEDTTVTIRRLNFQALVMSLNSVAELLELHAEDAFTDCLEMNSGEDASPEVRDQLLIMAEQMASDADYLQGFLKGAMQPHLGTEDSVPKLIFRKAPVFEKYLKDHPEYDVDKADECPWMPAMPASIESSSVRPVITETLAPAELKDLLDADQQIDVVVPIDFQDFLGISHEALWLLVEERIGGQSIKIWHIEFSPVGAKDGHVLLRVTGAVEFLNEEASDADDSSDIPD